MSAPSSACPVCTAEQPEGLCCHDCTSRLERNLSEVRGIVDELAVTISKQARIGQAGKPGPARERSPVNWGASAVADNLGNVLTTWAHEIVSNPCGRWMHQPAQDGAHILLGNINLVRRHPAVAELVDEIADALSQARKVIDRPADRQYLGQCMAPTPDVQGRDITCLADVWARQHAHAATCSACGITHDVAERRAWLLLQASDMLVTAKEASRYIGEVGHIRVTEASIRGLIHRERIAYRPGTKTLRLGDLLDVLTDMRAAA